jgi:hypothetical protein
MGKRLWDDSTLNMKRREKLRANQITIGGLLPGQMEKT